MRSLPTVSFQQDFTTTGTYAPFKSEGVMVPLTRPVSKWSMQVSGLSALNLAASLTAWNVVLVGSIDGIYFPATSILVSHVSGTNANGDVAFPTVSTFSPFRDAKYVQLNIVSLTLNAATKIRVSVRGF